MFFSPTGRLQLTPSFLAISLAVFLVRDFPAQAQYDPLWAQKMFEATEFKFGNVAKGADSAIQLKIKNPYKEDIQITNLSTGCGCVQWWETTRNDPQVEHLPIVVRSGQQRVLTLKLNTIQFEGERKSKATVSLFDPVHGDPKIVEFPVYAFIRRDVVITPGAVNFGTVDLGSTADRKVQIAYAGRPDWKLTQVKATNPNVGVEFREVSRRDLGPGNTQVTYELTVGLKPQAPVGTLRDQIIFVTDDANSPQLPINVEAVVEADVVITDLQFGTIAPGQSITKTVVIRGKKPLKIEELYREKKGDSKLKDEAFKVKLSKAASTVHSLPVTFTAPDIPGVFEEDFFVKIEDRPQPIPFKAKGRIIEQTGAAKQ